MKRLPNIAAAFVSLSALAQPAAAHCKSRTCDWPDPFPLVRSYESPKTGPVHGAPGLIYHMTKRCFFDRFTTAHLGHCFTDATLYNCNTRTATFPWQHVDSRVQGSPIIPGDIGDSLCRKAGFL